MIATHPLARCSLCFLWLLTLVLFGSMSRTSYAQTEDHKATYYNILEQYGAGDSLDAFVDLMTFIEAQPRAMAHAYVQLIQWANFHDRMDDAEAFLLRLYDDTDAPAGALGLAHLRLRQKHPTEALRFAKEATAWQPPWITEDEHPYGVVTLAYRDLRDPPSGFAYFDSLRMALPEYELAADLASLTLAISTGQPKRLAQHAQALAAYEETMQAAARTSTLGDQGDVSSVHDEPQALVYWQLVGLARYYTGDRARAMDAFTTYRNLLDATAYVHGLSGAAIGQASASVWVAGIDTAVVYFEEAYQWATRFGDHRRRMITINGLASMKAEQGKVSEAIPQFETLGPLAERTESPVIRYAATVNLARLYRVVGRSEKADAMVHAGVALAPTTKAPQHEVYALIQLAEMEHAHGNYTAAIHAYERLLGVAQRTGIAHDETRALVQLAELYTFLSDTTRAAFYAQQALDVAAQQTYVYPQFIAARARAGLHVHQGQHNEAAALYQQALAQVGTQNGSQYRCDIELGLGYAHYLQGRWGDAIRHFRNGIRTADAIQYVAGQIGHRVRLARVYRAQGRLNAADQLLTEAASRSATVQRPDFEWLIWAEKAALAEAQEQPEVALTAYEQALDAFEQSRAGVPDELKAGFLEDYRDLYARAAFLTHGLSPARAFHIAERARARHLAEITGRLRAERTLPDSLQARLYAFNERLTTIRTKLSQPLVDTTHIRLQAERDQIQAEKSRFFAELAVNQPNLYQALHPPVRSVKDLQQQLHPEDLVLTYLVGDTQTLAFGITRDTLVSTVLEIGQATLAARVQQLLPWLVESSTQAYNLETGYAFYTDIVDPIIAQLPAGQRLTIIPDDALFYVPFDLLPTTAPVGPQRYTNVRYLLHTYAIRYSPSVSMLYDMIAHPPPEQALLALGNPRFPASADTTNGTSLPPLPGTEHEMRRARAHLSGHILTEAEATEAAWRAAAPNHRILHLATHALLDDHQPMYSSIVLTPPDTSHTSKDDGYLQSYELYSQRLAADLAVLSACNTARGRLQQGEGLVGLVRGFQQAGVPSVVASLWPVNDAATTSLMDRFYTHLAAGHPTDAALRAAKLDWLTNASDLRANPFYWASFIPIGPSDLVIATTSRPPLWVWLLSIAFLGTFAFAFRVLRS